MTLSYELRFPSNHMMKSTIHQELASADLEGLIQFSEYAAVFAKMDQPIFPQWDSPAEAKEVEFLLTAGFRTWENTVWQHNEACAKESPTATRRLSLH